MPSPTCLETVTADRIAPRLAAIFANAEVGLSELDAQGRFLLVNAALCRFLRHSEEALLTMRVSDVTHPADLPESMALLGTIARDGRTRAMDKRYRAADGHVVWARSTITRLPDAPDDPAVFLVVTEDLSEQRRAEQARLESEQRARTLIEGVALATWETDAQGQFTGDWPSWRAHTGQSLEAAVGDGWLEAVHPEDREYARRQWREAVAAQRLVNAEFRIKRATVGHDWVNLRAAPVLGDNGEMRKWVAMTINISARKSAEAAVRASERRLQTLVSGIPQLVWRAVEGGQWTWASPQWEAITGQSRIQSAGFGWLDAVHPDDREHTLSRWAEAGRSGALEVEHRLFNPKNGRYCWFQCRASPVRLDDGTIVEWLGTTTDVHDLRALHERQNILVAELQHRTRNLLGLVRVIADKTLAGSRDFDDSRSRFRDRMNALARVQSLVSRFDENEVVSLDRLIREELAAHDITPDAGHVRLCGPDGLALRSQSLQPLAMALHELSTNAVKYGVFGRRDSQLSIHWGLELDDEGQRVLRIDWIESGVDLDTGVEGFSSSGQGRELIERVLPYQLQARTSYVLTPDGVNCSIAIPVERALLD